MAGSFSWCLLFTLIGFEAYLDYCPSKDLQILGPNQLKDRPPVLTKLDRYNEEHGLRPTIVLIGSSLAQFSSNLCDAHFYGRPDLNKEFASYSRFRYLDEAVSKASGNTTVVETANLANPGTMISEDFLILKEVLSKKNPPKAVVLEIGPRDFIDNMTPEPYRSRLSQVLSKRQEPFSWRRDRTLSENMDITAEKTSLFYSMRGEFHDCLVRIACDYLHHPASMYQASLLSKMAPPQGALSAKSSKEQPAVPSGKSVSQEALKQVDKEMRFGHIDDRPGNEAFMAYSESEYKNRYLPINRKKWSAEAACLRQIVGYCASRKIPLVVVNMPLTERNLNILPADFKAEYEQTIKAILKPEPGNSSLVFVDLRTDKRFVQNDFRDTVHMRSTGGAKLVDLIGPIVAAKLSAPDPGAANMRFAAKAGSIQ